MPGILPVSNVATTRRFAGQCGAAIPAWMDRLFEGLDELPQARQLVAATIAGELAGNFMPAASGFPFLHTEPGRAGLCHLPYAGSPPVSAASELRAAAATRILVKDGAYGTLIQAEGLKEGDFRGELSLNHDQRGNNDLLNLTRPDIVRKIAQRFVGSGADILATNTFNANRISQSDYGAEHLVPEINRSAAQIIREVADKASSKNGRLWVAGALGPTNKTLSLSPDVNDPGYREVDFETVKTVYREQIDALVEGDRLRPDRDGVRHAQLQGGDQGRAGGRAGPGPRAADYDFDDPHGPVRSQPQRPYGGRVLGQCSPR